MSKLDLVKSQIDILKVLAQSKTRYRNAILKKADKSLIQAICEIVHNVLKGNINISTQDRENLKKYRKTLHRLLEKSNLKSKKKIIIQRGGFLQFLIPAIVTGIADIVSSFISSTNSQQ